MEEITEQVLDVVYECERGKVIEAYVYFGIPEETAELLWRMTAFDCLEGMTYLLEGLGVGDCVYDEDPIKRLRKTIEVQCVEKVGRMLREVSEEALVRDMRGRLEGLKRISGSSEKILGLLKDHGGDVSRLEKIRKKRNTANERFGISEREIEEFVSHKFVTWKYGDVCV